QHVGVGEARHTDDPAIRALKPASRLDGPANIERARNTDGPHKETGTPAAAQIRCVVAVGSVLKKASVGVRAPIRQPKYPSAVGHADRLAIDSEITGAKEGRSRACID